MPHTCVAAAKLNKNEVILNGIAEEKPAGISCGLSDPSLLPRASA
jgi:hypothetical protein